VADFFLRAATAADEQEIRALIRAVQINPMGLDWHRFVVAASAEGAIGGCGQVKPHGEEARELASIAVWAQYRGQGIARAIIEDLLRQNPGSLYLMCRPLLGPFYEKFGFREIPQNEMPTYFRRISRLARLLMGLSRADDYLMVMKRG
jgi:N-acetylglutamate synthase-like GNAT family acetyltransferase